jgi:hypothetical protein
MGLIAAAIMLEDPALTGWVKGEDGRREGEQGGAVFQQQCPPAMWQHYRNAKGLEKDRGEQAPGTADL